MPLARRALGPCAVLALASACSAPPKEPVAEVDPPVDAGAAPVVSPAVKVAPPSVEVADVLKPPGYEMPGPSFSEWVNPSRCSDIPKDGAIKDPDEPGVGWLARVTRQSLRRHFAILRACCKNRRDGLVDQACVAAKKNADKPAEADKPAPKPAAAGGGREFDRGAASAALSAAAGAARGCKKEDGPTGTARVEATFAPNGSIASSSVKGAPFSGTPVGNCIAAAFRDAHVPAFDGAPVTVTKSVTLN